MLNHLWKNKILIAVIITLILVLIYYSLSLVECHDEFTLPQVYNFKSADSPKIVILSGSHGNEPGPGTYLENLDVKNWIPGDYYIVPYVNIDAIMRNERTVNNIDINRSWPNGTNINKFLLPLIKQADLVVDFHEGWGFHECNFTSLGQTLYTNTPQILGDCLKHIAFELKKFTENDLCTKWTILDSLPVIRGTLDELCHKEEIPYILVEIAGQNDIQPLHTRAAITSFILYKLFVDPEFS
jgi:predicted deacylase